LEVRNAELERFTYTVSHDLKSPLITIQGFLGLLVQDVAAGDTEQIRHDVNRISVAVKKMEQLLNELLELSRIGRVINPPDEIHLGELVHEAVDMVAGQLGDSGVQVEIAPELLPSGNGLTVYGDRPRLLEVLQNLVDNAVKYMGNQPAPRVAIGTRNDGDDTIVYVRDNGLGIDPRYHEQIFGLFNKLDHESVGVGVGLTIVKRIVEVHGGRVWVESAGEGHGSTFCFTLNSK
jgi:signal transduction histidine kinase